MFGDIPIEFTAPEYLWLGLLLPLLWLIGYRSLSALTPTRRAVALLLRSAVILAVAVAPAEVRYVRTSEQVTVLYLLDQSRSIPAPLRETMAECSRR